jgi:outer membrane protein TolC
VSAGAVAAPPSRSALRGLALALALAAGGSPAAGAVTPGDQAGSAAPVPSLAPPDSPALPLAEAVARSLAAAAPVAAARAVEAAARAQLADAEADLVPALSFAGSAFRHQKPTLVTPIHGFTPGLLPTFDRNLLWGDLQLRYELWDGGARAARIAQRREQLAAAQAAADATAGTVAARAVASYLAVLTLAEQAAAHEQRSRALAAEWQRVDQLLAVGRAARVDLLRVEAAEAAADAELVVVVVARESAARDLQRLMGEDPEARLLPPLIEVTLAAEVPPALAGLLGRAVERSPQVARARRELAAAAAAVDAARATRAPAVRAEGHYLGFAGGNGERAAEWNAGLRVAVPLWDRHLAARVALAEAGRDAAAASLRLAQDQVGAEVDRAWADLHAAHARASSLVEAEARHAEVVRVEKLRLAAGVGVEADYLRAEADLLQARASAIEARHRAAAARAELQRTTGELSAEWVERAFAAEPPAAAAAEDGR